MGVSLAKRPSRPFDGVLYPIGRPFRVSEGCVKRVHMFDVPTVLREHAHAVVSGEPGTGWRAVGEFHVTDGSYGTDRNALRGACVTVVARRVVRGGAVSVEYGVEI